MKGLSGDSYRKSWKNGGKVRLQESSMRLGDEIVYKNEVSGAAFTMRHDILAEVDGQVFVLDTKYKEISRFEGNPEYRKTLTDEAKQGDLYQVLEYARKRGIEDVYLLYPMYRYEQRESEFPVAISKDPKGSINIHFIRMPFVFEEDEENTKNQLVKVIKQMFFLRFNYPLHLTCQLDNIGTVKSLSYNIPN